MRTIIANLAPRLVRALVCASLFATTACTVRLGGAGSVPSHRVQTAIPDRPGEVITCTGGVCVVATPEVHPGQHEGQAPLIPSVGVNF